MNCNIAIAYSVTLDYEFNDKWQNAWYNGFTIRSLKETGRSVSRMGYYVNPSAESFAAIARSKTYVDKTGLIEYMNTVVQTDFINIVNRI